MHCPIGCVAPHVSVVTKRIMKPSETPNEIPVLGVSHGVQVRFATIQRNILLRSEMLASGVRECWCVVRSQRDLTRKRARGENKLEAPWTGED